MHALRRNDWHVTRRDPWDLDGRWRGPSGGLASWSLLKDIAILVAYIGDLPNGSPMTANATPEPLPGILAIRPDLAAILGRELKATPGPWKWEGSDFNGGRQLEADIEYRQENPVLVPYVCDSCDKGESRTCLGPSPADSDFIEHAREDIPALLKYIHALETMLHLKAPKGPPC
jgi:hypothetical protein